MKVVDIVTEKILTALESGCAPWVRPWNTCAPYNAVSGKYYTGCNRLLLSLGGGCAFMTAKQVREAGGTVPDTRGELVTYYGGYTPKNTGEEARAYRFLKYYLVWPVQQCGGLDKQKEAELARISAAGAEKIDHCEEVLNIAHIVYGGDKACYSPASDTISLPVPESFKDTTSFYATAFHELGHWTGAASRLARGLRNGFGSAEYAAEELVADITAAMLCADNGLDFNATLENTAAYCSSWAKRIRDNKVAIIGAASKAEKAVAFISEKVAA